MLILMKQNAAPQQVEAVCEQIREIGFVPHRIPGAMRTTM